MEITTEQKKLESLKEFFTISVAAFNFVETTLKTIGQPTTRKQIEMKKLQQRALDVVLKISVGKLNSNKIDAITELIKDELEFCKEIDCEKNEHDQFIYESKNGKSSMNLPYVLQEYKQWLINKKIVKERGNF